MSKNNRNGNKQTQVSKVSKETKVDEKDLARLPQDALQKLDDMTEDDDLLGGDVDGNVAPESLPPSTDGHDGSPMPPVEPPVSLPPVTPSVNPSQNQQVETEEGHIHHGADHILIGYHPVSGDPVYK